MQSRSSDLTDNQFLDDNSPAQVQEVVTMQTSIFPDKEFPNDWHVETIDMDSGDILVAVFSGPDSEERAREYATWQESKRHSAQPVAA